MNDNTLSSPVAETLVEAPKKIKYALCMNTLDRFKPMDQWKTFLVDRAICDSKENVDTSIVQILPYISLIDENGFVFAYTRGNAGAESRLFDLKSVGLGGHMDEAPAPGESLADLVVREACREVLEECGWECPPDQMREALSRSIVLYAPVTEVDSVHVAIGMVVQCKRSDVTKVEEGQIVNPEWFDTQSLAVHATISQFVKPESMKFSFETWSTHMLRINSSEQTFMGYQANRQNMEKAFERMEHLVSLFAAFAEDPAAPRARLTHNVTAGKGENLTLEVSLDGQDWKQLKPPVEAAWAVLTIQDGNITLSQGTPNTASVTTRDFVLWTINHAGPADAEAPEGLPAHQNADLDRDDPAYTGGSPSNDAIQLEHEAAQGDRASDTEAPEGQANTAPAAPNGEPVAS